MITRMAAISIGVGLVSGCTPISPPPAAGGPAADAKPVLEIIADANISRADPSGVADCIISNATPSELISLAGASSTGITQKTVEIALDIAERDGAIACFADLGLSRVTG